MHTSLLKQVFPLIPHLSQCIIPARTLPGILTDKVVAKITLIAFTYCFTPWFSALVRGTGVIEGTIKTAPHITMTTGTDILPRDDAVYLQLPTTKRAPLHTISFLSSA